MYRRAPVRSEPLPGATSFFQEELQKLRELHTTSDFLQAAAALNPLVQTLPQLVHHKVCRGLESACPSGTPNALQVACSWTF